MTSTGTSDVRRSIGEALPPGTSLRDLRRVAGGTSHETFACDVADGSRLERVLVRRDIGAGVIEGDGEAEFALLRRLHELELPVPRPWRRVPARDGNPSMTFMEWIEGEDVRKAMARGGVADRRGLGRRLVAVQAAVHAVDVEAVAAGPAREPAAEVERWAERVDAHRDRAEPLLAAAASWLRAHAPARAESCLVHADFKANNLLLSPDGRVTVVDWEMAHVGDPLEDLAWTLLWDTEHDLVRGMLERPDYLAEWERVSGRAVDPDALFFWELFSLVKLAAIFAAGLRPEVGPSPTLRMLERAIPVLEARIASRLRRALAGGRP